MLGAAAILPPLFPRRVLAKPIFDSYPFTLGIASGDPLPDGIVLWTRLAPKPLDTGDYIYEGAPMAAGTKAPPATQQRRTLHAR